jgi:hypothetical protein
VTTLIAVVGQSGSLPSGIVSSGHSEWVLIACALAAVALIVTGLFVRGAMRKARTGDPSSSTQELFSELCDAHELNRLERTLITQLAATYELPQPSVFFVDPWTLEQAAAAPGPDAHRYEALRHKLFGSLE